MKKTKTEIAMDLLQRGGPVCGQDMVDAGVGYRYAARINDLKQVGHPIISEPCTEHRHGARVACYTLVPAEDTQLVFGGTVQ